MLKVSDALIALVALFHFGFMILETFLWKGRIGAASFGMSKSMAETTAPLAANQGVYNLFLAAGLVFAFTFRGEAPFRSVATFFLACVVVAGMFGAATVSARIFPIQSLPAIAGLLALWMGL